jgi:hypothetical protein
MTTKDYFPGSPKQTNPLVPGKTATVTIDQECDKDVVQYEFYIPAKIWDHKAVKDFRAKLGTISIGATIFKGTIGIWKFPKMRKEEEQEVVEDTHIYRLIKGEIHDEEKIIIRAQLRNYIEEMMLKLSEWDESKQQEFLFTETVIFNNRAMLK